MEIGDENSPLPRVATFGDVSPFFHMDAHVVYSAKPRIMCRASNESSLASGAVDHYSFRLLICVVVFLLDFPLE
jgi:hypothetical protein